MKKTDFFILLAALWVLGTYFAGAAKELVESGFVDFSHYYKNAILLKSGNDIWGRAQQVEPPQDVFTPHPGFAGLGTVVHSTGFFLCMLPFTALPFRVAAYLAFFLGHALFFFSLWLLIKTVKQKFSFEDLFPVIFLVFAFWPLREQLHHNQPNLFIFFFLTAALYLLKKKKCLWAGIVLGIAFQFREYLAVVTLFFLWKRYWKALLGIGIGIVVLKLAAIGVFGWDKEVAYWRYIVQHFTVAHDYTIINSNLSFTAAVFHILRGVISRPVGLAIVACVNVVCIVRALRATKSAHSDLVRGFGLFLALAFLVTPWVHESHYVVLCLALLIAWFSLENKPRHYILFALAYLLLGVRYSLYRFEAFYYSLPAVLFYLKCVGVILLFVLLDAQTRRIHADR